MKKSAICFLLFFILLSCMSSAETREDLILTGSVNVLLPADSDYSDIYGDSIILPEFTVNVKILDDWYAWAGYGFLSADGTTPVFGGDAKSSQDFIFFGAAYKLQITEGLKSLIKLGAGFISYKEEALDTTIEESTFGFLADCSLYYDITEYFSIFASCGYIGGSDTVNDEDVNLGGFKAGGGIAINF